MSYPAWMPLHIDHYIRDTDHLSATEHGAYLLLIMKYWREGGLPADEGLIRRYAKLTAEQWTESRSVLAAFFEDGWKHGRIDAELAKADDIIEKRKAAGKKTQFGGKSPASARQVPEQVLDKSSVPLTNNIDSYPASQHSYGGTAIDLRIPDLLAALGITDETKTPGLISLSEPIRWVEGGCDIDADIIPTLREFAAKGKQPRSWSYCSEAVFEARDRRLRPVPEPRARAPTNGRRMNAVEANIARRIRKNEQQGERRGDGNAELLPPDGTGLRSLVGDAGAAMRWRDRPGGD